MAAPAIAIPLAVGAASGAATAGYGAINARRAAQAQNAAIEAQQRQANQQLQAQRRVIAQRAAVQQQAVQREGQRIIGRLRTAASAGGVGVDASTLALIRQTDIDGGLNRAIIRLNQATGQDQALLQRNQTALGLESRRSNPTLAAFNAALGGVQTGLGVASAGLNIGQAIKGAQATAPAATPPDYWETSDAWAG